MAGLTAPPDNSEPSAGQVIEADGWFPGIDTAHVRDTIRLGDGVVTEARLVEAVLAGMLFALRELSVWRTARALEGHADLQAVSADMIGGINKGELIWRRVVSFYAGAELVDGHADIAATDDALDREEEKADVAARYRRKSYEAVADLRAHGLPEGEDAPHGRNRISLL